MNATFIPNLASATTSSAEHPVITALREQVDCYRRLAKLADLQHVHVQQSQTEQLLEVLASRQDVLDQLKAYEQTIAPQRKRWAEFLCELTGTARDSAETLLAETRRLLEAITTADRNDALVLQQQKLSLGRQINAASAARQVNRTYAAAAYGSRPARLDLQR
jgi:septal ring factor EnvC (AmiA/AmiB activator)